MSNKILHIQLGEFDGSLQSIANWLAYIRCTCVVWHPSHVSPLFDTKETHVAKSGVAYRSYKHLAIPVEVHNLLVDWINHQPPHVQSKFSMSPSLFEARYEYHERLDEFRSELQALRVRKHEDRKSSATHDAPDAQPKSMPKSESDGLTSADAQGRVTISVSDYDPSTSKSEHLLSLDDWPLLEEPIPDSNKLILELYQSVLRRPVMIGLAKTIREQNIRIDPLLVSLSAKLVGARFDVVDAAISSGVARLCALLGLYVTEDEARWMRLSQIGIYDIHSR